MKVTYDIRVSLLMMIAAAAVAYVRNGLEKKWAGWDGISHFLSSWFIHYLALWFLTFLVGAGVERGRTLFLGGPPQYKSIESLEFRYFIAMAALVTAIAIFVVAIGRFEVRGDYW